MKSISRRKTIALCAVMAVIGIGLIVANPAFAEESNNCTNVLSSSWCNKGSGEGVKDVIMLVVNIMTAGLFVAATVGFVWCGSLIITARDDPAQVAKARKRMIEIVIGLVVWILSAVAINLLIPGSNDAMKKLGTGGVIVTSIQL